ncbi:MAG: type I glyceraldehyde-3-phosphate dehydrogenase [Candidatus Zambryskibacteria bacterium CG11_big_fil_rev_8_21_14_0_20_42_18]|uniref:Type I glyceraldehyde-3-phosphate dehydrogenase n=1 Tax=Candidatus Zambryskibacteria bacterium CG_4_9_14_3_um_filter_42_15 TaxID=1975112 RepID=A0A2M7WSZ6_9BACT|nr:MAG: type I glyceraldehyde-3-phosphate dehydrogenase [Candidatus Zambryskibacteria bacterium CG11_big_fil_rev_8_21_14_0_20_42_18]PJA33073.1 MAG: type I glyceraldehyde-3-phosphate dehydrogenase [Candidatus Zambryskibacteria bacterium CG_4_9_14_3_um_filter_42_15]
MKIKIAINGAGRIGRAFYKLAREREEVEVVAINDLGNIENIAYLLKFDTVYGKSGLEIEVKDGDLVVNGEKIKFLSEKDPAKLPWKDLGVDVVIESTGFFTTYAGSKAHLDAGAKRVVVTAPMKDDPIEGIEGSTVLMGVNEEKLSTCLISSNASCTTNAGSPLIAILDETIGIEKAVLNTVHGYTASQSLVDGPSKKDFREGRSAAQNIVPSSTGAAIAVTKAFTKLEGLFDGIAVRVPVVAGSLVDVTFIAKRETTVEEVNNILKKAAGEKRWEGVFTVTEEKLVSSDIVGSLYGSIADLNFTRVVSGNLVKVMSWYDNELGYSNTLLNHVIKLGKYIK